METKDFTEYHTALEFVKNLPQDKYVVDLCKMSETQYRVSWLHHKKYTTYDNEEYNDEVWMTEHGRMIHCQDLTPDHAKNIIRMMLRNARDMGNQLIDLELAAKSALADLRSRAEDQDHEYKVTDDTFIIPGSGTLQ